MAWAVRDSRTKPITPGFLTAAWAIKVNEGPLNYRPRHFVYKKAEAAHE